MKGDIPGGPVASRPLYFIWILDCSGSMSVEGKIEKLNFGIREAIPQMRQIANSAPNAEVLIRTIKFSDGAQWINSKPVPVDKFVWKDLQADGPTDMGKAFSSVAEQLKIPPMTSRALPPVLILVSDGQPTDDYAAGLRKLNAVPWGKKAIRRAIAIEPDANYSILKKFINQDEIKPITVKEIEKISEAVRIVSTEALAFASQAAMKADKPKPKPTPKPSKPSDKDVF